VLVAYEEESATLGRLIPIQPGPLLRSLNRPSVLLSHDVVHVVGVKVHTGPLWLHPGRIQVLMLYRSLLAPNRRSAPAVPRSRREAGRRFQSRLHNIAPLAQLSPGAPIQLGFTPS
jgi:hypothetical protein